MISECSKGGKRDIFRTRSIKKQLLRTQLGTWILFCSKKIQITNKNSIGSRQTMHLPGDHIQTDCIYLEIIFGQRHSNRSKENIYVLKTKPERIIQGKVLDMKKINSYGPNCCISGNASQVILLIREVNCLEGLSLGNRSWQTIMLGYTKFVSATRD